MATDDRAIVVGVKIYPDLGDLGGPEIDAQAFYDWVVSPTGGDVPSDHVELILSSQFHPPFASARTAEPTTIRVEQAFDKLLEIADTNSRNDEGMRVGRRLYIYLAGHGFAPRSDQTGLLMANATKVRAGYHILGKSYAEWFFRAGYFDEIVLFMDCCRENYPLAPLNAPPYNDVNAPDAVDRVKYLHIYATKWSRLSRERPMEDGRVHGVFTSALLAGLRGGASDPNTGNITAGSLGDYLTNNMKTFLKREDLDDPEIPKEPEVLYEPKNRDSFVLLQGSVAEFPVTLHLPADWVGKQVEILGDKFVPVTSASAAPPLWQVKLKRGTYMAHIVGDGGPKIFEVSGTGGDANVNL